MNSQLINFQKFLLLSFLLAFLVLPNFFSLAQNPEETKECNTRQECEELLKEYESKIAKYEKEISETGQKSKTLKNQIYILKNKIKKLKLEIRQSNAIVKELKIEITDTEGSIEKTISEIENSKKNLATLLRTIYKEDQKSDLEILLSGEKISDYFNHLANLQALNLRNQEILGNVETARALLDNQKKSLEEDKWDLEQMLKIQILQKKENEDTKKENDEFLKLTEAQYQKLEKKKKTAEKKAAKIRARLLELVGVRKAPTYEEAILVAEQVSKITGIRSAFLLGILTQESRIGKEVGQCYLQDFETGMGIKFKTNKKWPRVMKPSWIPLFLQTTRDLNLDPKTTPVSCWIRACANNYDVYQGSNYVSVDSEGKITCHCQNCVPFGWGGAMGPAQLMPFNWIGSDKYKEKIEVITGKTANPWDFANSALGAALHLKDCRADLSERKAAACYFGGWGNRNRSYHLSVYADPVLRISKCHQDFIDKGSMSSWCEKIIF